MHHLTLDNNSPTNHSKYDSLPRFLKAGLVYLSKYENVRRQGFQQRFIVSDLLKAKGNTFYKDNQIEEACREYEQVLFTLSKFLFPIGIVYFQIHNQ